VSAPAPSRGRSGRIGLVAASAVGLVVVALLAFSIGRLSALDTARPSNTSADAGFDRDMQVHHDQGVQLAILIRERTDDPAVRRLAYDIETTQAQQSGQLYGWLTLWGLPQASSEPSMAWMADGEHESMSGSSMAMPGLATPAQIATLTSETGVEAERTFLTLMIAHHRGAIEMADAALQRAHNPAILTFARGVIASQRPEITAMTRMLADRTP
jgi:uncharacterized protein (DUF305 family)